MAPLPFKTSNRTFTLVLAVGAVAAFAGFAPSAGSSAAPPPEPAPSAAVATADLALPSWALAAPEEDNGDDSAESAGTSVSGKVLEQLDVAKYSYLRLAGSNARDTWVAVPVTTSRVGTSVTVMNAELMAQFASASLKRTFDEIYFGVLDDAPAAAATEHGASDSALDLRTDPHSSQQAPHPGPGRGADSVPVAACEKAAGPLGRTVAELHTLDASASGARARVRGTVVKVTGGVMGRSFVHLRDATGKAPLSNDLTATTTEDLSLGSQVLLEGTIKIDEDFGSGYRYPVLLADAHVVTP